MKLQTLLVFAKLCSTNALDASCPEAYCDNEVVNTEPIVDSSILCPDLVPETLATFKYLHNGVNYTLIELRGPSDPRDAADLVIAAPHGGNLRDDVDGFIDDRAEDGVYCPDGCKTSADSFTKEIAEVSLMFYLLEQEVIIHGRISEPLSIAATSNQIHLKLLQGSIPYHQPYTSIKARCQPRDR
jgi:hypothetical protein